MSSTSLSKPVRGQLSVHSGVWLFPGSQTARLGGRAPRVAARAVDLFLLGVVGLVLLSIMLSDGWVGRSFGFIGAVGLYGSYACLLGLYGRTFGKALFGLQVVQADGSRAGFLRGVVIREGLRLVFTLLQIGNLIDLALLFRDDRRTAHDFASGTIVIYKPLRSASDADR